MSTKPASTLPSPPDPTGWVRLDQLEAGHCGVITHVEAGDAEVDQLKSMGVCLGREVMLVRAGDPLILKVMGTRIGMSARLATGVRVSACHGDAFGQQ